MSYQSLIENKVIIFFKSFTPTPEKSVWDKRILIASYYAEFRPLNSNTKSMKDSEVSFYKLLYFGTDGEKLKPVWEINYIDSNRTSSHKQMSNKEDGEWSISWVLSENYPQETINECNYQFMAKKTLDTENMKKQVKDFLDQYSVDGTLQDRLILFYDDPKKVQLSPVDIDARKELDINSCTLEYGTKNQWKIQSFNGNVNEKQFSTYDEDEWSLYSVLCKLYKQDYITRFKNKALQQIKRQQGESEKLRSLALLNQKLDQLLLLHTNIAH